MNKKPLKPLPPYYGKVELCDGRKAWLESFTPPGRKHPTHYTLIICSDDEAPELTDFTSDGEAFAALAKVTRQAVLDL